MSKSVIIVTIGVTALFAFVIFGQLLMIKDHFFLYVMSIALSAVYILTFIFRPVGYQITDDALIILRPASNVSLKKDQLVSVEAISRKEISGTLRTFGVGGLFGYYGKFANFKLGNMTWYATRKTNTVLIKTVDNKKIILTPDDPEGFIKELHIGFNL